MYNDTIKVANKIITYDDLLDIFSFMQEKLMYYKKVYNSEQMQNKMLDYGYQKWTFKDSDSSLKFNVNFYDDTNIKFDNYNNFVGIFNNRLHEIKSIWVTFNISYSATGMNGKNNFYYQRISMDISEKGINIDVSLSSEDKKIDDVYELIKNKILNAREKYDEVIRNKSSINTTVSFALGFIPSIIICILLLFVPTIRFMFASSYVLFPICCLMLTFVIGGTIASSKLDNLYKPLIPDKKYVGYDSRKGKSIYKDDIDKFMDTSEILIGKNVDNLKNRQYIMDYYNKYKEYISYEIIVLVVVSIFVLFLK